jgi:putative CocE/NonD family hydrolase
MRIKSPAAFLSMLIISCCAAQTMPRGVHAQQAQAADGKQAGDRMPRYPGYSEPRYKDVSTTSTYVAAADGTRIAVEVLLPAGLPAGAKIPTLLNFTRYWRARETGQPDSLQKFFVGHGYALVVVDVRGTGASFGVWTMPWSKDEVKDYGAVVDWVVAQAWSDGRVGAYGSSYGGNSAHHLAALKHPAVKAVLPRHYEFDEFTDVPFPGGVFNEWGVRTWDVSNHELDRGQGVKPVDGDADRALLRRAVEEHAKNIDLYNAARQITFRDDRVSAGGATLDDISLHSRAPEMSRSKVAINSWGGWLDAGTADAVIKSFLALDNPHRAIIGPWNHGATQNASPYFSAASQRVSIMYEWLRFFDQHLKGVGTGIDAGKVLFYYTMGEERWKATRSWPVAGTRAVRWYMADGNSLSPAAPAAAAGSDAYKVDFEATTGDKNRWRTQLGGQVVYTDRAEADRRLLTYTSPPLAEDVEITGHPIISLHVASTHADGAFFVYLEEVDEAGKVTYLTEGQLRAIHRKVSKDAPARATPAPYRTFKRRDAMPLVPGEVAELRFGLLPTSVLVRKGHRIRVAVAGHDKSVFARTPADATPVISVQRNSRHASFIELPVVPASARDAAPVNLLTYFAADAGRTPARVDPKIYDSYAGRYEMSQGFIISITSEGGRLLGEAPGQPKVELLPETETEFSVAGSNMKITFVRGEGGSVSGLVLRQNGQERKARKVN